jgi:putative ubiquitin-RnfH superfamily antitoxin RatB of RatAB toxin-antitoxin module
MRKILAVLLCAMLMLSCLSIPAMAEDVKEITVFFKNELPWDNMVAEAITKAGVKVSRAQIDLAEPIKQLGVYTVAVKVFSDVEAQVKVWVVAEK